MSKYKIPYYYPTEVSSSNTINYPISPTYSSSQYIGTNSISSPYIYSDQALNYTVNYNDFDLSARETGIDISKLSKSLFYQCNQKCCFCDNLFSSMKIETALFQDYKPTYYFTDEYNSSSLKYENCLSYNFNCNTCNYSIFSECHKKIEDIPKQIIKRNLKFSILNNSIAILWDNINLPGIVFINSENKSETINLSFSEDLDKIKRRVETYINFK